MIILPQTTIAAAAANQLSQVVDLKANGLKLPLTLGVQFTFLFGSGGTSIAAWLQGTIDNVNWQDIASFSALQVAKRTILVVNRQTSKLAPITNTDGSLAADTALDLILPSLRVKYTSVGTYAGATSLRADVWGEN